MKKSFMTRALATGLSLAMAFSLTAATNVTTAAAASAPAMKSKTMTVKVGQSKNYAATAATQKAYKITKIKMSTDGKTKAKVTINSSKKSIKVEGLKATKGKNVVITFKNNKTGKKTTVTSKVVVKANAATLTSVAQKTATKLTATLATAIEKIDLADVKIVRDETNTVIPVKSATIDTTDATKVVIETYTDMADGKVYTVTYTAQDAAKTVSEAKFTATDSKIAGFALSTATVTTNKATTIKYSALDANGVVIYEKGINDKPNGIDIEVTSDNGFVDGSKLTLMTTGATAKVTVTYHTYKYDAAGNEQDVIKKEFTITAVENSAAASKFNYTIVKKDVSPAWENLTVNTKLATNDNDRVAKFQIKDSNGEDITATCGYTVESSNSQIVIAAGDVNSGATLVPVTEGSAYLILKDGTKTVTTFPITVVAKRIIANFTLDKTSVSIATTAALASNGSASIGYTAKDQYGDKIEVDLSAPECKSMPANASAPSVNIVGNKITIETDNATKGTYSYTVTATAGDKKQTKSFSVNVVAPKSTDGKSYVLQFTKGVGTVSGAAALTSMNTTITNDSNAAQTIAVSIAEKQSGVIVGPLNTTATTVSVSSIKVTGSDGKTYAASGANITKKVTSDAIDAMALAKGLNASGDVNGKLFDISVVTGTQDFVKNLPAGSYKVEVVISVTDDGKTTKKTATGSFTITDAQPVLTANVVATNTEETSIKAVFKNANFVKFVYGGVTQVKDGDSDIGEVVKVYGYVNGKTCVVNKVTVNVKVPGGSNTVQMTVPVNRVFTTTADQWTNEVTKP